MKRGYLMPDGKVLDYQDYMNRQFVDITSSFFGFRSFPKGAQLPALFKPIEAAFKGGKKVYSANRKANRWIEKNLKKNFKHPDLAKNPKRFKAKETLKKVARPLNKHKKKIAIGTTLLGLQSLGQNPMSNPSKMEWYRRKRVSSRLL